jgi:hypothetical protein
MWVCGQNVVGLKFNVGGTVMASTQCGCCISRGIVVIKSGTETQLVVHFNKQTNKQTNKII